MAMVGGPIKGMSLGGRVVSVDEAAEISRGIGGDNNEVLMNGDETGRLIKTLVPWKEDGISAACDDDLELHEYIQGLANRNGFFPITTEYRNGSIWQGDGQIVGEILYSSKNTTITFNVAGTGRFTQQ
jgi:hypothetical protein